MAKKTRQNKVISATATAVTATKTSKKAKSQKIKEITNDSKSKTQLSSSSSTNAVKLPCSLVPVIKSKSHMNGNSSKVIALIPNAVYYALNFFTESECQAWIQLAEKNIGFEYVSHPASRFIAQRECGRIQSTNWELSKIIFERMQMLQMMDQIHPFIGVTSSHSDYRPITCNGNLRIYKYEKGMSFGKHIDGSDRIPEVSNGNTEITVLVYLTTLSSGATRFYPAKSSKKDKAGIAFTPQAGAVLFHVHGDRCLEHEADPVQSGIKYVLRTDIVYGT